MKPSVLEKGKAVTGLANDREHSGDVHDSGCEGYNRNTAGCICGGCGTAAERLCRPVYENSETALLGRYLVMTPWMLLDRLKECQDEAESLRDSVYRRGVGAERRFGRQVNPLAERLDRLSQEINHMLQLLWRGGLWTEDGVEMRSASDGREFHVLREPFTDGKPHGRPLPTDAPDWQRELLGVPTSKQVKE